ncbi:transposase [Methanonatronarchaeum sp. AMET6-2]|uniref:transposase n=1 Tax=Methanonatronarchaeum sp. AMET6-2 TaxID=2933293 RepID=UPI001FF3F794|nr:transposase [Methanonatronarchaeum sp. AMET6-2]UOY10607.1 transposase [Methanonatronarchaeum sp. AMET6-2]
MTDAATRFCDHLAAEAQRLVSGTDADDTGTLDAVTVAATIDVTPLRVANNGGARSQFDCEPMIRAHLFRHLRDMQFMADLATHLNENPGDAEQLGFDADDTPSRPACSRWWNRYLDDDVCTALDAGATDIAEQLHDAGIPADFRAFNPEQPDGDSHRTKTRTKKREARNMLKGTRRWLYDDLYLKRNPNTKHEECSFWDLLVQMAIENEFTTEAADGFEDHVRDHQDNPPTDDDEERVTPSADTLLYHLHKFDEDELEALFEHLMDMLCEIADRLGLFDHPVDIAIDENTVPYYGDRSDDKITNIKKKGGTNYGYKFLTICIVGPSGERFKLGFAPITSDEEWREQAPNLIERAKEYATVKKVYADRAYYDARMVQAIEKTGVKYVIRAQRTPESKKMWAALQHMERDVDFKQGSSVARKKAAPYVEMPTNRIVGPSISDDEGHMALITNIPLTQKSAEQLFEAYRDRWGIETSYRVAGGFRGKTTSKEFSVRLFYYMFSVLLYNVWVLTNAVVRDALDRSRKKSPPVTAKKVLRILRALHPGIT